MQEKDIEFLEESFKQFYFEHFDLLHVPENPNQREFGFQKFNSGMKRHISCLLYTSPSPRDRTRSRMPSSA